MRMERGREGRESPACEEREKEKGVPGKGRTKPERGIRARHKGGPTSGVSAANRSSLMVRDQAD